VPRPSAVVGASPLAPLGLRPWARAPGPAPGAGVRSRA